MQIRKCSRNRPAPAALWSAVAAATALQRNLRRQRQKTRAGPEGADLVHGKPLQGSTAHPDPRTVEKQGPRISDAFQSGSFAAALRRARGGGRCDSL